MTAPAMHIAAMVQRAARQYGRRDAAFNNAGIEGAMAPTVDCTQENFDRTIAVNLRGVFLCMKREIAEMLAVAAIVLSLWKFRLPTDDFLKDDAMVAVLYFTADLVHHSTGRYWRVGAPQLTSPRILDGFRLHETSRWRPVLLRYEPA